MQVPPLRYEAKGERPQLYPGVGVDCSPDARRGFDYQWLARESLGLQIPSRTVSVRDALAAP
jgi:hypothetical protein